MTLTCIKWFRAAGIAAVLALWSMIAAAQGATDTDVLAAKEAVQKGNWKALEQLKPRFAGHVLEAYPAYWLLAGTLDRAEPRDVQAFLEKYSATPLAESLRREWLRALGAAGSWDLFRAEFS